MLRQLTSRARSLVRHSPVYPLLRTRHFQAFCVGAPKTGTTSVGRLFAAGWRAAHEPLEAATTDMVLAAYRGEVLRPDLERYLKWRDRELYLEMESSHLVAVFVPALVDLFPRSRFILTVREPRAWLQSVINEQLKGRQHRSTARPTGPRVKFFPALHELLCGPDGKRFGSGDRVLEQHGLYSLRGYLTWWANHNQAILRSVPADRLLVVRTENISAELDALAAFLGIDPATLSAASGHANRGARRIPLVDEIAPDYLSDLVAEYCSEVQAEIADLEVSPTPAELLVGPDSRGTASPAVGVSSSSDASGGSSPSSHSS